MNDGTNFVTIDGTRWPDKIQGANPEKLDQTTLLELYAYKDIDLAPRISQEEFLREKL